MHKHASSGFTLIELMIVVAIIAILAAIAIPAYQDYVVRAQVTEGMSLATGAKTAVWDYFAQHGAMPTDNAQAGLPAAAGIASKYVKTVEVTNGRVNVTFASGGGFRANSAINNAILALSPLTTAGSIAWGCSPSAGTTVDAKYLPSACR
ncbi:MAG TPA: pilin [Tahibacter sp.]|nr:pilin [Tahibacter sp.]